MFLTFFLACAPKNAHVDAVADAATITPEVPALAADLDRMWRWFPGEYGNHEQVLQHIYEEREDPYPELHHLFLPVTVPALGEHVLYVRQRAADGAPYRVRLYTLGIDEAAGAIRMDILRFADEAAWMDAHLDPGRFASLNVETDLVALPGCEITWRADGDAFTGTTGDGTCQIESARLGTTLVITDDLRLTESLLSIQDVARTPEGSVVFGHPDGDPHLNRKLRYFDGWATIRPGGHTDPAEDEWMLHRSLRLHTEGGTVSLRDASGEPMGYRVELARLTRSSSGTEVLKLAIIDEETDKTISYAWTEPGAERIGMNLGWGQVGLRLSDTAPGYAQDWLAPDPVMLLSSYLQGTFDSSAQAAAQEDYFDIRLQACAVDAPEVGEVVLYVEQAVSASADQPYRQRLYSLAATENGEVRSTIYALNDPEAAIGLCERADGAHFAADAVSLREGCDVFVSLDGDTFTGSTRGENCSSTRQGATFATVAVSVTPDGLSSWDQGWSSPGEQVWGAVAGPYEFRRVE